MGRAGARKARSALFTLTAALQIVLICSVAAGAAASVDPAGDQPLQGASPAGSEWYFWNEITGKTQWEDPGDVPFEDEKAGRYWLSPSGEHLGYDPNAHRYSWVENWSEEHSRPFYYNQRTKVSKWEKPADLAWRRVQAEPQAAAGSEEL